MLMFLHHATGKNHYINLTRRNTEQTKYGGCFLSENSINGKIKIYKTLILPIFCLGVGTGLSLRGEQKLSTGEFMTVRGMK